MRQMRRTAAIPKTDIRWLLALGLPGIGVMLCAMALHAAAQEAPSPHFGGDFQSRPKLTGDWDGTRDQWATKGFTADFNTTYTFQDVASGGIPNGGHSTGNTFSGDMLLELNTTKAELWPGGLFKLRLEGRAGESALGRAGSISPANADALLPSVADHTDDTVFGLTEFNYAQFFSPYFGIVGGLMNTADADDNPIAGNSRRNSTFLNVSFLASMVEFTGAPNVALGGGLVFLPTPDIIGTISAMGSQETATENPFDNWNGTTVATEWTFKHQLGGLPGGQVLGGLYSIHKERTDIFEDPRIFLRNLIVNRAVQTTDKDSWALYYNVHQYIQGDRNQGWGPFLRAGFSDGDPNPVKWNLSVGVGGKGLFPGREQDGWGLGYYHLDLRDAGLLKVVNIGDEDGAELFYNVAVAPSVHATFDTQYISSARAAQDPAWVVGVRLGMDF